VENRSEKIIKAFLDIAHPKTQSKNEINHLQTIVLSSFAAFFSAAMVVYALMYQFLIQVEFLAVCSLVGALLSIMTIFIYRFTGLFRLAANLLIFVGILDITATSLYTGGINSPIIYWLVMTPLVCAILDSKVSAFYWSCVGVVIIMIMQIFEQKLSAIFLNMIGDTAYEMIHLLTLVGMALMLVLCTLFYRSVIDFLLVQKEDQASSVN